MTIDYEAAVEYLDEIESLMTYGQMKGLVNAALGDTVRYEINPMVTWILPEEQAVLDKLIVQFYPKVKE